MIDGLSIDEIADRMLRERNYLGRTYYDENDKLTHYVHVDKFSTIYDILYSDLVIPRRPYPSVEYQFLLEYFNKAIRSKNFLITETSSIGEIGPFVRKIKIKMNNGTAKKYEITEVKLKNYDFMKSGIFALSKQKKLIDFLKDVERIYKKLRRKEKWQD